MRIILAGLIVPLIFSFGYTQTEDRCDLTVIITGFQNNEGYVRLALTNSEETYQGKKPAIVRLFAGIENKTATFNIEKLAYGNYAIKVFHDEDQDDELDTNFLGIPSEGYEFSNDVRGTFGPPEFEKAKFLLNQKEMEIAITIK